MGPISVGGPGYCTPDLLTDEPLGLGPVPSRTQLHRQLVDARVLDSEKTDYSLSQSPASDPLAA